MKRTLGIILLFLFNTFVFSLSAEASTTLLVYLCGANLTESACIDIYEMAEAKTGDDVRIAVLAGGAPSWEYEEIGGNTRTFLTIEDGYFGTIEDWGWKSMGSEESLLEFLEYGLTEYPADRTAVVLWDHGAGSEAGICFDYTTDDEDGLSLNEINDVLYDLHEKMGGFHIDIFGCDACLMASYEMAAMLSYYDIDYFLASEELEPDTGWNYTSFLQALGRNPRMSNEELCEIIVDSYFDASLEDDPDAYLTLSAIDLSAVGALQDAVEDFAGALLEELDRGNIADVRRGRSRLYTLGSFDDGSWDMVDMEQVLSAYAMFDPNIAASVKKELSGAVLYSRQTDNLDKCCGLSMLIPQDTKDEFEEYVDGLDLSFYMPNWIGFVKTYAEALSSGSYSFGNTTPAQIPGGSSGGFFSHISEFIKDTAGTYGWDEDSGEYIASEESSPEVHFGENDYAFTALLSKEDLRYLDYVEGMLMMDISDGETTAYIDFGLIRNNLINWDTGEVCSLFDGSCPFLGDQPVPIYDQMNTASGRRSLIPVKLNGEYTYLVVEFDSGSTDGRIIGANAGYDEGGLPIRSTTPLHDGDSVIPVYTMYYEGEEESEELEEQEFDGDEIIWSDGIAVQYLDIRDEEDPFDMMFCFVLNNLFGEYTLTDIIDFRL